MLGAASVLVSTCKVVVLVGEGFHTQDDCWEGRNPEKVIEHTRNYNPPSWRGGAWPSSRIYKGSSRSSSFLAVLVQSVHTFFLSMTSSVDIFSRKKPSSRQSLRGRLQKKKVLRQLCGGTRMEKERQKRVKLLVVTLKDGSGVLLVTLVWVSFAGRRWRCFLLIYPTSGFGVQNTK